MLVIPPRPAWAVICQATADDPNATANADDGDSAEPIPPAVSTPTPAARTATIPPMASLQCQRRNSLNTAIGADANASGAGSANFAGGERRCRERRWQQQRSGGARRRRRAGTQATIRRRFLRRLRGVQTATTPRAALQQTPAARAVRMMRPAPSPTPAARTAIIPLQGFKRMPAARTARTARLAMRSTRAAT